ncbi:hypothetical protein NXH76_28505 [Blautia schinkii]|nr:hypothetical protein [Blautia schinkii]
MEFIYDDCMEEYQALEGRMEFIVPKESYSAEASKIAQRIQEIYTVKLDEITQVLVESEDFKEYYAEFERAEVGLRLGRPTIMLEFNESGVAFGTVSYFENKIDENQVIQVRFKGELEEIEAE